MQAEQPKNELLLRAMTGRSVDVSGLTYSLHDLTQIALALQPNAALSIRDAVLMTPLERASITTVCVGTVVFL